MIRENESRKIFFSFLKIFSEVTKNYKEANYIQSNHNFKIVFDFCKKNLLNEMVKNTKEKRFFTKFIKFAEFYLTNYYNFMITQK